MPTKEKLLLYSVVLMTFQASRWQPKMQKLVAVIYPDLCHHNKPWKLTRSFLQSAKPLQTRQAFFNKKLNYFLIESKIISEKKYVNYSRASADKVPSFYIFLCPLLHLFCFVSATRVISVSHFCSFCSANVLHSTQLAVCSIIK